MRQMRLSPLRFQSYRQGALYSTILNVISRGLGFVVHLVIAYHFGTGEAVGVYFYCLSAVFTVGLFLGMVNASVLIPESMRIAEQYGEMQSQAFLNVFLLGYTGMGLALMMILQLYPVDLLLLLSRFNRALLEAHAGIVMHTTMLLPFVMLSTFLMEILNSRRFFTVGMLANLISGLCVLIFIGLFRETLGVRGIAIGMLVGYLLQVIGALLMMMKLLDWRFRPSWQHHGSQVWKDILFAQTGNICTVFVSYLPFFLLSNFSSVMIAALSFGMALSAMPTTLLTDQISTVVGIKLNTLLSRDQHDEVDQAFRRACHFLLFLLVPVSLFCALHAEILVSLIYGRGAFDAESVRTSADFFRLLVLIPPFIAVNTMVSRLFMGARMVRQGVWYQILINGLMAVSIFMAVHFAGPYGYPVGLLVTYVLNLFFGYVLVKYYFPEVSYLGVVGYFVKMLVVCGLLLFIVTMVARRIPATGVTVVLLTNLLAYGGGLLALNHWLHLNDDLKFGLHELAARFSGKSV